MCMYVYVYMCVHVCVCVCVAMSKNKCPRKKNFKIGSRLSCRSLNSGEGMNDGRKVGRKAAHSLTSVSNV